MKSSIIFKVTTGLLVLTATLGCRAHVSTSPGVQPSKPSSDDLRMAKAWDEFWRARKVLPAPPRDFMDSNSSVPEIFNLTNGLLGDDVVRKWVMADLRRGRGDAWAAHHFRLDIVNADVLGPPGLNGTEQWIVAEQAKGTIGIVCPAGVVVAAGVVIVSADTQRRLAGMGLTDFVIVQTFQGTGEPCKRTLADGTMEVLPLLRARGELSWQLDAGEFRNDPIVGPLWYQAQGWGCNADVRGPLDGICGLVHPNVQTMTMAVPTGTESRPQ